VEIWRIKRGGVPSSGSLVKEDEVPRAQTK
jgi:hypothetical protein